VIRFLTTEDVAARYCVTVRTVHGWTQKDELPCRVLPRTRRILFEEPVLTEYEQTGCELERVDLPHGGRIVRPKRPRGDA
jgi:hypothetical protein